ncbi:MAG: bifunctional DNA primase/polymerase, partial [Bacilli bacterium]
MIRENIENYIMLGYALIPCIPKGKRPIEQGWQNSKPTTKEDYDRWDKKYPNMNIGMLTGKASSIIAIDVDGESGMKHLDKISNEDLPKTAKYITPGGGIRLLYKYPNDIELKTKVDRLEGEHSEVCFMSDGKQTL